MALPCTAEPKTTYYCAPLEIWSSLKFRILNITWQISHFKWLKHHRNAGIYDPLFWSDDVYSTRIHKGPCLYFCFPSVTELGQARACFFMKLSLSLNYGHLLQGDIVFSMWDLLSSLPNESYWGTVSEISRLLQTDLFFQSNSLTH